MTTPRDHFVHLGYSVGRGEAVMIPIRHMVVTGQTQESGKTTTLEALIERAPGGRPKADGPFRAITFITKRGERAFAEGTQLAPYFRTKKADWQYVSSLIDVTMGEKNKLLRSFLMKTCRNTATLADVLVNVRDAKSSSRGFSESIYTEIEGYLELVVPQLAQLPPAHKLTLRTGLNVMDVSPYTTELQALVLRSVLDAIYADEKGVIVVIPEAWEFLPEGRGSPVKAAAERLIRKGAVLGNFMWLDSQDLAGVWKTAVRACAVALIGVQREANEIKRTLANIHTASKPKAADVAGLELGEFFACWGTHATKTYVQPATMAHTRAMAVARGTEDKIAWQPAARPRVKAERLLIPGDSIRITEEPVRDAGMESVGSILKRVTKAPAAIDQIEEFVTRGRRAQQAANKIIAEHNAKGAFMSDKAEEKLDQLLARFGEFQKTMVEKYGPGSLMAPALMPPARAARQVEDPEGDTVRGRRLEELSDRELDQLVSSVADVVIDRMVAMATSGNPSRLAGVLAVLQHQPELVIKVQKHTLEASDESVDGRLGILIHDGHFDKPATAYSAWTELNARQWKHDRRTIERGVAGLATKGFLRKEADGYIVVSGMKRNVVTVPA